MENVKPYKPWDFCKSVKCRQLYKPDKSQCRGCRAYQMHDYLQSHNLILQEGSQLAKDIEALRRVKEEEHGR